MSRLLAPLLVLLSLGIAQGSIIDCNSREWVAHMCGRGTGGKNVAVFKCPKKPCRHLHILILDLVDGLLEGPLIVYFNPDNPI